AAFASKEITEQSDKLREICLPLVWLQKEGNQFRCQNDSFHVDGGIVLHRRHCALCLAECIRHFTHKLFGGNKDGESPIFTFGLSQSLDSLEGLSFESRHSLIGILGKFHQPNTGIFISA